MHFFLARSNKKKVKKKIDLPTYLVPTLFFRDVTLNKLFISLVLKMFPGFLNLFPKSVYI